MPQFSQWLAQLPFFQLARNVAVHSVTHKSPHYLHRNREITLPHYAPAVTEEQFGSISQLHNWLADFQTAKDALNRARAIMRRNMTPLRLRHSHTTLNRPQVNDLVLIHTKVWNNTSLSKAAPRYYGPYRVTRLGRSTCDVVACFGKHVQHGHTKKSPKWAVPYDTMIPYHQQDATQIEYIPTPTGTTAGALQMSSTTSIGNPNSLPHEQQEAHSSNGSVGLTALEQARRDGRVVEHEGRSYTIIAIKAKAKPQQRTHYLCETLETDTLIPVLHTSFKSPYLKSLKNKFNAEYRKTTV